MNSETRLMEANMWAYMACIPSQIETVQLLQNQEFWLMNARVADAAYNFVTHTRNITPPSIEKALAVFSENQWPFGWWISPSDTPAHLPQQLTHYGLRCTDITLGMSISLENLSLWHENAPTLQIQRVSNALQLTDFITVVSAFHQPQATQIYYQNAAQVILHPNQTEINLMVGYQDEKPVSALYLYLDKYSQTAGIYSVSTLPAFRNKGFATLLTCHALHYAKGLGYKIGVLQATDAALSMYQRLGFKICCEVIAFGV
ncbi:GNAT family N-acetyltransferase [Flexibacter flexilis]|nr:GNAT family N-acetyltransferase [Flexibacter flexilis]